MTGDLSITFRLFLVSRETIIYRLPIQLTLKTSACKEIGNVSHETKNYSQLFNCKLKSWL